MVAWTWGRTQERSGEMSGTTRQVLTELHGCSMRMTSDVDGRADMSGTIRGHNVALAPRTDPLSRTIVCNLGQEAN